MDDKVLLTTVLYISQNKEQSLHAAHTDWMKIKLHPYSLGKFQSFAYHAVVFSYKMVLHGGHFDIGMVMIGPGLSHVM